MIKKAIIIFLTLNLISCLTIQTKTKPNEAIEECDLVTEKYEFDTKGKFLSGYKGLGGSGGGKEMAAILLAILATEMSYTSLSAVIASSIYLTGNIIHWVEKSISCDDGSVTENDNEPIIYNELDQGY